MAQVSQEIMDLLSVDSLNAQIKDLLEQIEREKLIGESGYSLEGDDAKK